jgi:hypothetical protein
MLATVNDILTFMGETAAVEWNAVLTALIEQVSDQLASYAGRVDSHGVAALEKTDFTQIYSPEPRTPVIWTPGVPVISLTSVIEAADGVFDGDNASTLTANTDYHLAALNGLLNRDGYWLSGRATVQVIGRAGYTAADAWSATSAYAAAAVVKYLNLIYSCKLLVAAPGTGLANTAPDVDTTHWTLAAGERPVPHRLQRAAIMQATFDFQRRKKLGLNSESVQGGSAGSYATDDLLPEVKAIMDGFRRYGN